MTSQERVKTWVVLRDGMRVGNSVRNFGDFMPEAPTLPTFRTLLNTNLISEEWVDKERFEEWEKDQKERDENLAAGIDPDDVDDVDEDEEGEEGGQDLTPAPFVKKSPRKKVAKKTAAKKTTSKKTVKKGKSSGEESQGKRLSAERV